MGRLWLLVRFFLFVRCTYTYTCAACNVALRISFQLKTLLHTAQGYALCLSICILIHTTLTLHTFPLQIFVESTIIVHAFCFIYTLTVKVNVMISVSLYLH